MKKACPIIFGGRIPEGMSHNRYKQLHKTMPSHRRCHIEHDIYHQKLAFAKAASWQILADELIDKQDKEHNEDSIEEQRYDRHVHSKPHRLCIHYPVAVHNRKYASDDQRSEYSVFLRRHSHTSRL